MNRVYIPENGNGIKEGFYSINDICELLKDNLDNPTRIFYIADMIQEELFHRDQKGIE